MAEAAEALERGDLVIVPTETVYGLAGNALNPESVAKIFAAKERPSEHPLIIHSRDIAQARSLVVEWPQVASELASAFWPGPFTMVFQKSEAVPDEISAGRNTVAIRISNHKILKSLVDLIKFPIAAPSANRFTKLSPSSSGHLDPVLLTRCAGYLEGGPCDVGIESTVVSVVGGIVELLRPGRISQSEIEAVVGPITARTNSVGVAPGQHHAHYRPRTPVLLVDQISEEGSGLTFSVPKNVNQIQWSTDPAKAARMLYDALFRLDQMSNDVIEVEKPPTVSGWEAIWDRLSRAAFSENP
jgi:L-threonylcarbamoyladenylate synthase